MCCLFATKVFYMRVLGFIFLCVAIGILLACSHGQMGSNSALQTGLQDSVHIPKILFLNANCYTTRSGKDSCVLLNTMLVNGKLKASQHHEFNLNDGYVCEFVGRELIPMDRIPLENPLRKRMDVFEESGKIESHEIRLEENNLSVRVQYQSAFKWVRIWHYKSPKDSLCIATFNLSSL